MKPQELTNLISVQPGSVVSREVIRTSGGTITLFGFDAGQGLSDHQTSYEVMVLVLEGETTFVVKDAVYELKAGDSLTMQPNTPHSLTAKTPLKLLLIMLQASAA